MDEDAIAKEFAQVARVLVTAAGQWRERFARAEADRHRAAQVATAEDQQRIRKAAEDQSRADRDAAERRQRDEITAGRAVYGQVRRLDWQTDDIQRRVGEAFVAATALAEQDAVARSAQTYLVAEVKARYGPEADQWLAAAIRDWQEVQSEQPAAQPAPDRREDAERSDEREAEKADRAELAAAETEASHEAALAEEHARREKQRAVDQAREETAGHQRKADSEFPSSPATPPEAVAAQLQAGRVAQESHPVDPAEILNSPQGRTPRQAPAVQRHRRQRDLGRGR